jgi:hypothetical protein
MGVVEGRMPRSHMCDMTLRGLSPWVLREMNTSTALPEASHAQAMSSWMAGDGRCVTCDA